MALIGGTSVQRLIGGPLRSRARRSSPVTKYLGNNRWMRFTPGWNTGSPSYFTAPGPEQRLAREYQKSYDEAKAANESRYAEVLAGYRARETEAETTLAGMGAQEAKDITSRYAGLRTQGQQGLVSRGMGALLPSGMQTIRGGTVASTLNAGVARAETAEHARLQERLRAQRLNVMSGLQGQRLQFQERREDEYPDYGRLAQLSAGMAGTVRAGRPGRQSYSSQGGGGGLSMAGGTGFFGNPLGMMQALAPRGYSGQGQQSPLRRGISAMFQ